VNLIAAYAKRFSLGHRKIGLLIIHVGLVLLFVGQFLTETLQVESYMRLEEGQTKDYTENARKNELAIIDVSNPDREQVVSIPESYLQAKGEVRVPGLPLVIKVKEYFPNSLPAPARRAVAGDMQRLEATQGIGQRLFFQPQPTTVSTDDDNVSAALIEVSTSEGSLGSWTVSPWLSKYAHHLRRQLGPELAALLDIPQQFTYQNKTYNVSLRPIRYYKPFSLTLLDFTHKRYKGTEIPKDFSSRVRLRHPAKGEDREVLIYMNNPLRYAGETFYQGSFEPGDTVSILQVVRNPAWLTPYLSCTLVAIGLTVQFLSHLLNFGRRHSKSADARKPATPIPARVPESAVPEPDTPALAGVAADSRKSRRLEVSAKRRN
jgi:hypothetical protein